MSAVDGREPGMAISVMLKVGQVLSRSATCARYFSYSARVIRPPSRATRSWSRFDSEACTSSTRFHAASGTTRVGRYTWVPAAGHQLLADEAVAGAAPDFLVDELGDRLAGGAVAIRDARRRGHLSQGTTLPEPQSAKHVT